MSPAVVRVATPVWHCDPNAITCCPDQFGRSHLWRHGDSGFEADVRRRPGHDFVMCKNCNPPSYFFVVVVREPSPLATCYAIRAEDYFEWTRDPDALTFPTPEMLYRLRDPEGKSLNPHWRPMKERKR